MLILNVRTETICTLINSICKYLYNKIVAEILQWNFYKIHNRIYAYILPLFVLCRFFYVKLTASCGLSSDNSIFFRLMGWLVHSMLKGKNYSKWESAKNALFHNFVWVRLKKVSRWWFTLKSSIKILVSNNWSLWLNQCVLVCKMYGRKGTKKTRPSFIHCLPQCWRLHAPHYQPNV